MERTKKQKIIYAVSGILIMIFALCLVLGIFIYQVKYSTSSGTLRDGVIYLNHEEIYVYDSLESALTDTKCKDGPPKPLEEILPEILADKKLMYLEGTTVGICIDKQITEQEIPDSKSKEDRVVYKVGNYFLAESIPGE